MSSFPKPTRHADRRAYLEAFRDVCEFCGRYVAHPLNSKGEPTHGPHHIVSRGSGGPDCAENLIQLCDEHHRLAQDGHISKNELWTVVARRDGRPIVEVREVCLGYRRDALGGQK